METDVLQCGERVQCEALAFNGVVCGADEERSETGDIVYHVKVTGKAVLRKVAVAGSFLRRSSPL